MPGASVRAVPWAGLAWLLAALAAGHVGCGPAPAPASPSARCREAPSAGAAVSQAPSAGPASASAASSALRPGPGVPLLALDGAAEALAMPAVTYRMAAPGTRLVFAGQGADAWWLPENAGPRQPALRVDGRTGPSPWAPAVEAQLRGAADGAGGLWVTAVPSGRGVFDFARLERVIRLSAAGKPLVDAPFSAGLLRPSAVASDAAGRVSLLGAFAGTLATAAGPVTAPEQARAQVLLRLGPDGQPAWATVLGPDSADTLLAASPDGGALVVSGIEPTYPFTPRPATLTSVGADGKLRWQVTLAAPLLPVQLTGPLVASDGAGGALLAGDGIWPEDTPRSEATWVLARIDGAGKLRWARRMESLYGMTGDGAGSVLVSRLKEEALLVAEVDAAGEVKRRLTAVIPAGCADASKAADLTLGPTLLAVSLTCQAHDPSDFDQPPLGKPRLFAGTRAR